MISFQSFAHIFVSTTFVASTIRRRYCFGVRPMNCMSSIACFRFADFSRGAHFAASPEPERRASANNDRAAFFTFGFPKTNRSSNRPSSGSLGSNRRTNSGSRFSRNFSISRGTLRSPAPSRTSRAHRRIFAARIASTLSARSNVLMASRTESREAPIEEKRSTRADPVFE